MGRAIETEYLGSISTTNTPPTEPAENPEAPYLVPQLSLNVFRDNMQQELVDTALNSEDMVAARRAVVESNETEHKPPARVLFDLKRRVALTTERDPNGVTSRIGHFGHAIPVYLVNDGSYSIHQPNPAQKDEEPSVSMHDPHAALHTPSHHDNRHGPPNNRPPGRQDPERPRTRPMPPRGMATLITIAKRLMNTP